MKKWLIGLLLVLVLSVTAVYFFIPATLTISRYVTATITPDAAFRTLENDSVWKWCWPGTVAKNNKEKNIYSSDNYHFYINKVHLNSFEIDVTLNNDTSISVLQVLPGVNNTIALDWSMQLPSGKYPLAKLQRYFMAQKMAAIFEKVLAKMKIFLSDMKYVYGINIKQEKVQYRYLMALKKTYDHYPGIGEIYSMIDQVSNYIHQAGGKEQGNPMLHLSPTDSLHYEVQVALPLNEQLPGTDQITSKWMFKGGQILTAEVKGGNKSIEEATRMCEQYIQDYHHTIMAIPFQSLVTNRRNEPDTSKWITVIYYPVVLKL
jgi:hypothetical protein